MNIIIGRPTHGHQDTPEAAIKEELKSFAVNEYDDLTQYIHPLNVLTREWDEPKELERYIAENLEYNDAFDCRTFNNRHDAVKYLHTWSDSRNAWNIDSALEMAQEFGYTLEWINRAGLETLANLHYDEVNRQEVMNHLESFAERLYLIVKQAQRAKQDEEGEE